MAEVGAFWIAPMRLHVALACDAVAVGAQLLACSPHAVARAVTYALAFVFVDDGRYRQNDFGSHRIVGKTEALFARYDGNSAGAGGIHHADHVDEASPEAVGGGGVDYVAGYTPGEQSLEFAVDEGSSAAFVFFDDVGYVFHADVVGIEVSADILHLLLERLVGC